DIRVGDVRSPADIKSALDGCDAVVHCAVGTSWKPKEVFQVTVDGTRTVAEAALEAGVDRFVHISSMAVHRNGEGQPIDETWPIDPPPLGYGRNKLLAEREIDKAVARGLSAIILRPTRIYGPFSGTFTVRPLQALAEGRLVLSGN